MPARFAFERGWVSLAHVWDICLPTVGCCKHVALLCHQDACKGSDQPVLAVQATLKEALERVGFSEVSVSRVELPAPQDSAAQVQATARTRELGREPAMLSFAAKKA
jgi:hypothetical protein